MNVGHDEARREELLSRLAVIEGRRSTADGLTWATPGLAVAAQAFLLSIALSPDTKPLGRLIAALAGLMAAVATAHLYGKQMYFVDLYESFIESERLRLGLPSVAATSLRDTEFAPHTSLARRRWHDMHMWRNRLVVRQTSAVLWMVAFVGFVIIDGLLLIYALIAVAGADPGWLAV